MKTVHEQEVMEREAEPAAALGGGESLGFLDLALVLAKHRRRIAKVTLVAGLLGIALALLLPSIYTGRAVILTPVRAPSAALSLAGDPTMLAEMNMAAAAAWGLGDPNDTYLAMLRSRTVASRLIERFQLHQVYDEDRPSVLLKKLEDASRLRSGRDGTIIIEFDDRSPERAAAIANGYVEELEKLTQSLAVTEAGKRRLFFERQLEPAKEKLAEAEVELRQVQERTGMLEPQLQARALVEAVAMKRGEIAAQEVVLRGMQTYATPRHPEVIQAREQLAAMRAQLRDLERRQSAGEGDMLVGGRAAPEATLEYLRRWRDVKYHEAIYEMLARHYEASLMDEAGTGAVVQVMDPAVVPDRKSKPFRTLIVLLAAMFGFLLAYAASFTQEVFARMERDPGEAAKLQRIREALPRWPRRGGLLR